MKQQNKKDVASAPSVHKGHRQRLRNRLRIGRGEDFSDHELLEMLLFYALPRVNTNELAHKLIDEFGSLRHVLYAEPDSVVRVDGAGEAVSSCLLLVNAIYKRINLEKYDMARFTADTLSKVGNFVVDYYKDKQHEELCAMLLDDSFKLIEFVSISSGSVNNSSIDIKSFARYALIKNATRVILSHNHPSGNTTPSIYDRQVSMQLEAALRTLDIELVEHLIVNEVSYTPTLHMKTSGETGLLRANVYRNFYNN